MGIPPESRYASAIGRAGDARTYDVERGHIRRFAEATGDDNPAYLDDDAPLPAPPTFAIALRAPDPRAGLEIDFTKLLHAEQSLTFERALVAGDRLRVQATIVDAYAKEGKSGVLDFMVIETVGTDPGGAIVYRARSTTAIRR